MTWLRTAVAALVIVTTAGAAHAQVVTKKGLTLDGAFVSIRDIVV